MTTPLEFAAFSNELACRLQLDPVSAAQRSSNLFDDWGFDSLLAFQMVVVVEEMAELLAPVNDLPPIWTLGDAYDYYLQACAEADASWA